MVSGISSGNGYHAVRPNFMVPQTLASNQLRPSEKGSGLLDIKSNFPPPTYAVNSVQPRSVEGEALSGLVYVSSAPVPRLSFRSSF